MRLGDSTSRFAPLGLQRLRLLGCIAGKCKFDPPADANIFDAFRSHIGQLSKRLARETDPLTVSLLAAARFLTGDLVAANIVLDRLPAHAIELDHGAGSCLVMPLCALSTALPLPANLQETKRWVQGSAEQAALRAWLAEHRDKLHWVEREGVYRRIDLPAL
jgi:hypothetical protein